MENKELKSFSSEERSEIVEKWRETGILGISEAETGNEQEFINTRQLYESESKSLLYENKEETTEVFNRMVLLWKKLMKSTTLKVDFAKNHDDVAYVLKDEKSNFPLGVIYTYERRLILDYGGIQETIDREKLQEYKPMLEILSSLCMEERINSLEEELSVRYENNA